MGNYRKIKNKNDYEPNSRFGSQLCVGKVLASHNARPKTVPLIKWIEISMALQNVIFFLKIVITANKNKYKFTKNAV